MNKRIRENANKITFLVEQYPEKSLLEILKMCQMPSIDMNNALWAAQALKYMWEPDKETGKLKLRTTPDKWEFGETETNLEEAIIYALKQTAKSETDLEEHYLNQYIGGYFTHDQFIAIRHLVSTGKITEYEIVDGDDSENVYLFYSLPKNAHHKWGRKQFKKDPLTKELPDESDKPDEV